MTTVGPENSELTSGPSTEQALDTQVTGLRITAALIDFVLLLVLFFSGAAAAVVAGATNDSVLDLRLNNAEALLFAALATGYYVVFEALTASSPGKIVMRLEVAKLDGSAYGLAAVLVRNVLRIIDGVLVLYVIGLVCVAVTKNNQRIGDLVAGTTVVRAR